MRTPLFILLGYYYIYLIKDQTAAEEVRTDLFIKAKKRNYICSNHLDIMYGETKLNYDIANHTISHFCAYQF